MLYICTYLREGFTQSQVNSAVFKSELPLSILRGHKTFIASELELVEEEPEADDVTIMPTRIPIVELDRSHQPAKLQIAF